MIVLRLIAAAAILHLVLIQPSHPNALTWAALRMVPLELPVLIGLLIVLRPPARVVRAVLVAVLMLLIVLRAADIGMAIAYTRTFNPVTDMGLIDAGWRLGSASVGVPLAAGAVAAVLALLILMGWLIWWATGQWARLRPPPLWRGVAGVITLVAAGVVVADIGQVRRAWTLPADIPGSAFATRLGFERILLTQGTLRDLAAFTEAAQNDPFDGATALLDLTEGRDILIVFVESYGRASMDNPLYAPTHVETLRAAEAQLDMAPGVAMRSGWLTAPMTGGQSWLAHSSIASGLWISNQTRYRTFLLSPRRTLYDLAADAGFHTVAVMPAITLDWPEGAAMGYETILPAADLGYRGLPFNWVTMPDQYTLTAFDRLVLAERDARPILAQIALISSHAPWVPVPEMIPWEDVGDGTIYNEVAQSGDPPDMVWRDRDRVREQYRLAIDYALQAILGYAERQVGDMPLMIVLGDHQSAGFVAGSESFDVPIHVIGPESLVARIEDWGWTPGLVPAADAPAWTMDRFRDLFLSAYSSGGPAVAP